MPSTQCCGHFFLSGFQISLQITPVLLFVFAPFQQPHYESNGQIKIPKFPSTRTIFDLYGWQRKRLKYFFKNFQKK